MYSEIVNPFPWAICDTCELNNQNNPYANYVCLQCHNKNKISTFLNWRNGKIQKAIKDICVKNNWHEWDNQEMLKELQLMGLV